MKLISRLDRNSRLEQRAGWTPLLVLAQLRPTLYIGLAMITARQFFGHGLNLISASTSATGENIVRTNCETLSHSAKLTRRTTERRRGEWLQTCNSGTTRMRTAAVASRLRAAPQSQVELLLTWTKIGLITVLAIILYAGTAADLATEWWTQPEASYGMLIPPVAAFIAYTRRGITLSAPAETDAQGLWLTAFACLLLTAGGLAAEFFITRLSMVLLLAGLTWTFWGWPRFRTLAFPYLLLVTMIPIPSIIYNQIAAPLQLFASTVATSLAQAAGISIFRDGNIIHLANTSLGVAEACSGLHSLSAMVVAALLLGYIEEASYLGRFLIVLFSVPLAIAVNVVRITGTAILADYKLEYAMGFYHSFSGWLVFILGFGSLWALGRLLFRWAGRQQ